MSKQVFRLGTLLLAGVTAFGTGSGYARQGSDCNRRIANVTHDDIHFSVSISEDGNALALMVPEKSGTEPRAVWIRLRFRDESAVEGRPERQPSVAGGGYVDWRYRFDTKRPVTISGIFSVAIRVGDQSFEVRPW
jgi:hypothetical protein